MRDVQGEVPVTDTPIDDSKVILDSEGLPHLADLDALIARGAFPDEWNVQLTPEAAAQAQTLAATTPEYQGLPLRVYLEGKGCDGFYYGVTFADRLEGDVEFPHGDLAVVVDRKSLRFLLGATVQWIDDERGRGFLVDNPSHRRYRGKFFKRKAWLDLLAPGNTTEP